MPEAFIPSSDWKSLKACVIAGLRVGMTQKSSQRNAAVHKSFRAVSVTFAEKEYTEEAEIETKVLCVFIGFSYYTLLYN